MLLELFMIRNEVFEFLPPRFLYTGELDALIKLGNPRRRRTTAVQLVTFAALYNSSS
jgi:hypothetical protein